MTDSAGLAHLPACLGAAICRQRAVRVARRRASRLDYLVVARTPEMRRTEARPCCYYVKLPLLLLLLLLSFANVAPGEFCFYLSIRHHYRPLTRSPQQIQQCACIYVSLTRPTARVLAYRSMPCTRPGLKSGPAHGANPSLQSSG